MVGRADGGLGNDLHGRTGKHDPWLRSRDRWPPMSDLAADCGRGGIREALRPLQPVGSIEVGSISAAGGDATRSVIFGEAAG